MIAFDTQGPLVSFTAATSAPTSVQSNSLDGVPEQQYVLTNTSTSVDVIVGWGQTDAAAKAAAGAPTTNQNVYYLLHGSQVTITAAPGAFFTGVTTASTAVVQVQSGYGA